MHDACNCRGLSRSVQIVCCNVQFYSAVPRVHVGVIQHQIVGCDCLSCHGNVIQLAHSLATLGMNCNVDGPGTCLLRRRHIGVHWEHHVQFGRQQHRRRGAARQYYRCLQGARFDLRDLAG